MSRELTRHERLAAQHLCDERGRRLRDCIHGVSIMGDENNSSPCPTCRSDVVRLVDAPPRERVPEVLKVRAKQKDLAWLRMLANDAEGHPRYRAAASRILSVLEAVSAWQGRTK